MDAAAAKKLTKGALLLRKHMDAHRITYAEAAEALGVTRSGVHQWVHGDVRPRIELRIALEKWTDGDIKAGDWMTIEERRNIARVSSSSTPMKEKKS